MDPQKISRCSHNAFLQFHFSVSWGYLQQPSSSGGTSATTRPLTAKLRWCPFSSVPHVFDRLNPHNIKWASWTLHPGHLKVQEVKSNIVCCCTQYAYQCAQICMCVEAMQEVLNSWHTTRVYVTCRMFENKMAALSGCVRKKMAQSISLLVYSLLQPLKPLKIKKIKGNFGLFGTVWHFGSYNWEFLI